MEFGNIEIGGMSFGSVKIGGAKYGDTLVFQPGGGGGGGGGSISDYVQDGLILLLDGINKGNNAGSWTSLVGDEDVFENVGATFNGDNVQLGSNKYLRNTTFSAPAKGSGTIEVVYDAGTLYSSTNYIPIFTGKATGLIGYIAASTINGVYISLGSAGKTNCMSISKAKASFSVHTSQALEDGVARTQFSVGSDGPTLPSSTYNYIGRTSSRYTSAKIYSIRIYNRQITLAEALANYAVDQARFNL